MIKRKGDPYMRWLSYVLVSPLYLLVGVLAAGVATVAVAMGGFVLLASIPLLVVAVPFYGLCKLLGIKQSIVKWNKKS